jgi:uncharacterized protein
MRGFFLSVPVVVIFLLLTSSFAYCQEKPVPKDFHDDIVALLDLMGSRNLAVQYGEAFNRIVLSQLKAQDPKLAQKEIDAVKDETKKFTEEKLPELIEKLVPVYANHFTHEEVKALLAFYRSPLGMKTLKELPLIANESLGIGNFWGKSVMPDLQGRINARLQKEGYTSPKSQDGTPGPDKK